MTHLTKGYIVDYSEKGKADSEMCRSATTNTKMSCQWKHKITLLFQGGDEVIACSKKDMLSNEVQAGTYKNPILYQKPQRSDGEEIVTLIKVC